MSRPLMTKSVNYQIINFIDYFDRVIDTNFVKKNVNMEKGAKRNGT